MTQKISAVVNTYNARKRLQQVLDSLKGFDEIVVCDMESTDDTVEIARRNGCKVVTFPKGNYNIVEPARQFAIDSASHPWVLVVDADEVVPENLRKYLYEFISRPDAPSGLYIPRLNEFMGRFMHCTYPDLQLRFFRKEGTVWPPVIHKFPIINGPVEKIPRKRRDLAFLHYPDDTIKKRMN